MNEPEMYPLVDNPTYREDYDSFAELREQAEKMLGSLNFPLSWLLCPEEEGEPPQFSLCVFMPRVSKTTVWTALDVDVIEVQAWLDGFVKQNIAEWYGWTP